MGFNRKLRFNGTGASEEDAAVLRASNMATGSLLRSHGAGESAEERRSLPLAAIAISTASQDTTSPLVSISAFRFQIVQFPDGTSWYVPAENYGAQSFHARIVFNESQSDPEHLSSVGYIQTLWRDTAVSLPAALTQLSAFLQSGPVQSHSKSGALLTTVPVIYNAPFTIGRLRTLYQSNRQNYPLPYVHIDVMQLLMVRSALIESNSITAALDQYVSLPTTHLKRMYEESIESKLRDDLTTFYGGQFTSQLQADCVIPHLFIHALIGSTRLANILAEMTYVSGVESSTDKLVKKFDARRTKA